MSKVVLSTDDVVEAFSKMLERGVDKTALPGHNCNKYGIDVLTHKHDKARLLFHFVTVDQLEVSLELDMMELQKRGKEYLDHLYEMLCEQTNEARIVRQQDERIEIYTGRPSKAADAVRRAMH